MIDTRERNSKEELRLYTIEQLKELFRPSEELAEENPELAAKFEKVADISDLEEWLQEECGYGDVQPWQFIAEEVESLEELERQNNILSEIDSHGSINE